LKFLKDANVHPAWAAVNGVWHLQAYQYLTSRSDWLLLTCARRVP